MRFLRSFLILVCVLGLVATPNASAQSGSRIFVHANSTAPVTALIPGTTIDLQALALNINFSLLSAEGPAFNLDLEKFTVEVDGKPAAYPPSVTALEGGWSVVFLLDASATMADTRRTETLKSAHTAINSVVQTLRGSQFALMQFYDRPETIQNFTTDPDTLTASLTGKWRPKTRVGSNPNACLGSGLLEAVNGLSQVNFARKAIIILSASNDDCGGLGLTQQAVQTAQRNGIQIYSLGLSGLAATEDALRAITDPTGGHTEWREEKDMGLGFTTITTYIAFQKQIVAPVCLRAGDHAAVIKIQLPTGGLVESAPIAFTAADNFDCPPKVAIQGEVQSAKDVIKVGVPVADPQAIRRLIARVVAKSTGLSVRDQDLDIPTEDTIIPLEILAADLQAEADYTLEIIALDGQDRVLSRTEPKQFKFMPPLPGLAVAGVQNPTIDEPRYVVTITTQNMEDATAYVVGLTSERDPNRALIVQNTVQVNEPLTIPVEALNTGTYLVVVEARDANGRALTHVESFQVDYQRPSTMDYIVHWVRQNTNVMIGLGVALAIALIGLIGLVWFFFGPRGAGRQKTVEIGLQQKPRRTTVEDETPLVPASAAPPPPKPTPRPAPPPTASAPASSGTPVAQPPQKPPAASAAASSAAVAQPPQPASPPPASSTPSPAERTVLSPSAQKAQAATMPNATLTAQLPATLKYTTKITKTPFSIGRRDGNDAVLPVDAASGVSGQHCVILFAEGGYQVRDDKSTYGTSINGTAIPKGQPTPLTDGDVLGFGPNVTVRFSVTK